MSNPTPPALVLALARERDGYIRAGRADRVIPVDEQLFLLGWCVKADGSIVEYKPEPKKPESKSTGRFGKTERAVATSTPEKAVPDADA